MRILKHYLFLTTLTFLSSCATIVKSSKQEIPITYQQPDVEVYVNGLKQPNSTKSLLLKRKGEVLNDSSGTKGYILSFRKDGYDEQTIKLDRKNNGWIWPNLLSWGIVGIVVDLTTKAHKTLLPKEITVNLNKQ